MRLAEALLRVPDAETAIALTADQLGRADFDAAGDSTLARLSSSAIALSKKFLPGPPAPGTTTPGLVARLGARTVVAATLRAVQLLGRQFVLGQTIERSHGRGRRTPPAAAISASATTCWARARAPMRTHCATWRATRSAMKTIASTGHSDAGARGKTTEFPSSSARCTRATRTRTRCPRAGRAGAPRLDAVRAGRTRQHQPDHRRRGSGPAGAVAGRVRGAGGAGGAAHPHWRALAWRCRPTRRARWS
jgi:hypothetical protein